MSSLVLEKVMEDAGKPSASDFGNGSSIPFALQAKHQENPERRRRSNVSEDVHFQVRGETGILTSWRRSHSPLTRAGPDLSERDLWPARHPQVWQQFAPGKIQILSERFQIGTVQKGEFGEEDRPSFSEYSFIFRRHNIILLLVLVGGFVSLGSAKATRVLLSKEAVEELVGGVLVYRHIRHRHEEVDQLLVDLVP